MMGAQQNAEVMLPFWLKMFSHKPESVREQNVENEENSLRFSQESLSRIARLLSEGKTVVLMGRDQPYKVYANADNEIEIEPIEQFKFR
jgi:hypothetical protein